MSNYDVIKEKKITNDFLVEISVFGRSFCFYDVEDSVRTTLES